MLLLLLFTLLFSLPIAAKRPGEWNAKKYAQHSSPQFKNAIKELHLLNLKGNESILDIGCGNGQLGAYILKKLLPHGTLHGIDASLPQVQQAQKNYAHNKQLSFEQANVLTYESAKQYDVVISFWVLHWVKDYERALRQIFKALKPGGKALIGQLAEKDLIFFQEVKKALQEEPWRQHCKKYEFPIYSLPIDRIVRDARSAGFVLNYVQLVKEQEIFKNKDDYQHHYHVLPLSACIPDNQKKQFFNQVVQRALPREQHSKKGSITVNGSVGYILLEKPGT